MDSGGGVHLWEKRWFSSSILNHFALSGMPLSVELEPKFVLQQNTDRKWRTSTFSKLTFQTENNHTWQTKTKRKVTILNLVMEHDQDNNGGTLLPHYFNVSPLKLKSWKNIPLKVKRIFYRPFLTNNLTMKDTMTGEKVISQLKGLVRLITNNKLVANLNTWGIED